MGRCGVTCGILLLGLCSLPVSLFVSVAAVYGECGVDDARFLADLLPRCHYERGEDSLPARWVFASALAGSLVAANLLGLLLALDGGSSSSSSSQAGVQREKQPVLVDKAGSGGGVDMLRYSKGRHAGELDRLEFAVATTRVERFDAAFGAASGALAGMVAVNNAFVRAQREMVDTAACGSVTPVETGADAALVVQRHLRKLGCEPFVARDGALDVRVGQGATPPTSYARDLFASAQRAAEACGRAEAEAERLTLALRRVSEQSFAFAEEAPAEAEAAGLGFVAHHVRGAVVKNRRTLADAVRVLEAVRHAAAAALREMTAVFGEARPAAEVAKAAAQGSGEDGEDLQPVPPMLSRLRSSAAADRSPMGMALPMLNLDALEMGEGATGSPVRSPRLRELGRAGAGERAGEASTLDRSFADEEDEEERHCTVAIEDESKESGEVGWWPNPSTPTRSVLEQASRRAGGSTDARKVSRCEKKLRAARVETLRDFWRLAEATPRALEKRYGVPPAVVPEVLRLAAQQLELRE